MCIIITQLSVITTHNTAYMTLFFNYEQFNIMAINRNEIKLLTVDLHDLKLK